MIKNLYFKFLLIVPLSLLSCGETSEMVNDGHQNNVQENNYTSPYMGEWVGTYSGDAVSGTLILKVSKSGSVEVTRTGNGTMREVY